MRKGWLGRWFLTLNELTVTLSSVLKCHFWAKTTTGGLWSPHHMWSLNVNSDTRLTQRPVVRARVRRWTPWIIRNVEHNRHNGRSRIHFPRNCANDKADKDLKCIPGINIICSEDTEVLWRVEIVMIICWAGMTRDYCGPRLPEPWCMMPIGLPISDRNIIIHIVNTIIRNKNEILSFFAWTIWKFSARKLRFGRLVLANYCFATSDIRPGARGIAARTTRGERGDFLFSIIIHDSCKLAPAQDHT